MLPRLQAREVLFPEAKALVVTLNQQLRAKGVVAVWVKVNQAEPLQEILKQLPGDLWPEADLQDVMRYLRGGKCLEIPEDWRSYDTFARSSVQI